MTTETLLKKMDRIDSKLTNLMNKPVKEKETWVKASVITGLTGWNFSSMRTARKNGYVEYRKDEHENFWYLLESVNDHFKKK